MTGITKKFNTKSSSGFTLIELIVVLAVFLFIIGAAISVFLSIINNQKKVLAQQQFLSQVSYAQEYMSKAIRMARRDDTGGCLGAVNAGSFYALTRGGAGIKFINTSNDDNCQEFYFGKSSTEDVTLQELLNNASDETAAPIVAVKGGITSARFVVGDSTTGSNTQPKVTILLRVQIPGDDQEPVRTLQTTVSNRNLNVDE